MKNHAKTTGKKKSAGFTLIELIVTVSVAAILMSIAVPSFKQMIESNRLSTGTNELVSALILARSEALKRSQNVTVCTSSNSTTCSGDSDFRKGWIVFVDCDADGTFDNAGVDCDGDGAADDAEQVINARGNVSGLSILKDNNSTWQGYNFSGRSRGTGVFNVAPMSGTTIGAIQKRIMVNRTGRIKTEDVP